MPGDWLLYIHSLSNHPPNLIKKKSNSIHEKLSKNSSNEEIFNKAKCEYEDALKKSGFRVDFKYTKNQRQKTKKRSRNISKIYKGHNSKITSAPCNQLTLCNCRVKGKCPMNGKCQTMDAVYDCRVTSSEPQKSTLGWQKKNGSKGIITIRSHSITNNIHMRRHPQVMCGI